MSQTKGATNLTLVMVEVFAYLKFPENQTVVFKDYH